MHNHGPIDRSAFAPRTSRQEYHMERFAGYVDDFLREHLPETYTAAQYDRLAEEAREHARECMAEHSSLNAGERNPGLGTPGLIGGM